MKTRNRILGAATAVLLLGCSAKKAEIDDPEPGAIVGDGTIRELRASAHGGPQFALPLDATLSPNGKTAYFTALSADGRPSILTSQAPGSGSPTGLVAGAPLVSPLGIDISSDGETLVVADRSAGLESNDQGTLFAVSVHGGTPSAISGASGYQPKQVVVVKESEGDSIYFTGKTRNNEPGIFKLPLGGGVPTTLSKGAPWIDPSGISVASNGDVYVLDVNDGDSKLMRLAGDRVIQISGGLHVGYPAGIALSHNEQIILVSAVDPNNGTDVVVRVDLNHPESDPQMISAGIDTFSEPAGLKRAKNVDTYIWADSAANGSGTVFVINPQP